MDAGDSGQLWTELANLTQRIILREKLYEIRRRDENTNGKELVFTTVKDRLEILSKIEDIFLNVVDCVTKGIMPKIFYTNRRTWNLVSFDDDTGITMALDQATNNRMSTIDFGSPTSVQKFAIAMDILSRIYILLQTDQFSTKRDIYYQNPNLYCSQRKVDEIVDDICCSFRVQRNCLRIMATFKGCIAGDIRFLDGDGTYYDCSVTKTGVLIPADVDSIKHVQSNAKLILVIEKDATFQRLLDDLQEIPNHILITGKGFPDVNTRQMLKKLWNMLHIPVLALVDADPHGIEIMFTYRFGSLACSFDGRSLAVPSIRWLGVLPSDVVRLQLPPAALQPMTDVDRKKLEDLLQRPYLQPNNSVFADCFRLQLNILKAADRKAEIQAFQHFSHRFLSATYIPNKLLRGGWI